MWHLILYHGRKTVFGRVLIVCWIVFFFAVVLLFVRPKSLGRALPVIGPFIFLLVLTTMVYGAVSLWKAVRQQHKAFQPKMTVGKEAASPKPPIGTTRILVGAVVFASFVWTFWFQKGPVGYAYASGWVTQVSGGTSPTMLLWSGFGIVLFGILMKAKAPTQLDEFQIPSMWRRFCAFLLDFWFALLTLSGIFGILPVLLEAQRTGVFQWHFERDYGVASDSANVVWVFVFMGAMLLYFTFPLARRKQTVGCWVLRLATIRPGGDVLYLPMSTALWRVWKELIGCL